MVNFSPQEAEIVSLVWGTPANFNRFRVLAAFRGVATGVYRYIYPPKISPWKLFCALIAADVVRLLVYIGL